MDALKLAIPQIASGLAQNVNVLTPIIDLLKAIFKRDSHQCSSSLFDCAVFGFLFCLINYVFNSLVIRFVDFIVAQFGYDPNNTSWIYNLVYSSYYAFLIIPLLGFNKLLSAIWFQDIANVTMSQSGIRRNYNLRMSEWISDLIKSFLVQICYYLQGSFIYFVPLPTLFQHVWYSFHLALLSSLYAFEYKWMHMGWSLERRLQYIAKRWPYFLGYGLPLSLVTIIIPSFTDSMVVYATIFPVYIISSINTADSNSPVFSHSIDTFKVADKITDLLIKFSHCLPYMAIYSRLFYFVKLFIR